MRPQGLPDPERWPHGTRARYVGMKCRCDDCRKANREYHRKADKRAKELAKSIPLVLSPVVQIWTAPDGTKRERIYSKACQGVLGEPCPTKSHLRKNSTGGICSRCRDRIVGGRIEAGPVLAHIEHLSRNGVGTKTLAMRAGVGHSTIQDLRRGSQRLLRADTARRILAVTLDDKADKALVDAAPTWRLVRWMVKYAGCTKGEIALGIGMKTPALQLNKRRITFDSAKRVEAFYEKVKESLEDVRLCDECGMSHEKKDRLPMLVRLLPNTLEVLKEKLSCIYRPDKTGESRTLYRDLNSIGAISKDGEWHITH